MVDALNTEFELTDAEMHLYARQILLEGWDIEAQEKLKFSDICTYGLICCKRFASVSAL